MDLFTIIEDAQAIVRLPKGVHKQVKVYHRTGRIYVAHGGGFVCVTAKFGDAHGTSHPDVKVVDIDGAGIVRRGSELVYSPLAAVA